MATRIKLRRDTSTRWENINPILSLGEPGLETDTGKIKYGDGISTWNTLDYFAGEGGGTTDRLSDSGDEVILVGGADPYVTFPAVTGGDQLQIQGAEIGSISGSLALTSRDNLIIIANGSGDEPGGSKSWTFGANGAIDLVDNGVIRNQTDGKAVNIVANEFVQLQWTTDPGVSESDPNDTEELTNWLYVDSGGVNIQTNVNGSPAQHWWLFDPQGNFTKPAGAGLGGYRISIDENSNTVFESPAGLILTKTGTSFPFEQKSLVSIEDANVVITTDADDDAKHWTFDPTGKLTLPNGGEIDNSENNIELRASNHISLEATGVVNIYTDDGNHQWQFGDDGNLTLPAGGTIVDIGDSGNSLIILGTGATIAENQRAARVALNGDVEGVAIGAGTSDWTFTNDGDLTLPVGGDIKDSDGNSVLGGGTPSIPNTIKGFINLVGDRPNDYDDAWFEAVTVGGPYAYAAGGDWYIANNDNLTKVYKFNLETGDQVWAKKIVSGRGAQFTIDIAAGVPSVTSIDAAGVDYKVGEEIPIRGWQIGGSDPLNDIILIVDTINGTGGITSVSIKPGYNLTGITSNNVAIGHIDNARGDVNCIAYLPTTNKLVVIREHESNRGNAFDGYWQWSDIHVLDAETGEVESTKTLQEEGDVYANSIRVAPNGSNYAVVGEKYNEYREFGALTMAVKANGYFDILKSNLDPEHYPGAPFNNYGDFWITGTGISSMENVDNVNYYPNLSTTVRQGSGASFDITVTTPGGAYVPVVVATAGTNYRVGHKILVLGTDLEGTSPANDLVITVTSIDAGGGITGISTSGTSNAGATMMVYTRSGSNYQVGNGAAWTLVFSPVDASVTSDGPYNMGNNYVVGDVLTIPGTNFAGGTSPANDLTLTVTSTYFDGINGVSITGSVPSNILRINVDGVDFTAVGGSWSMKQNLGGEAFVWTPTWSNAIGGPSGDRFYDVCWNDDGSALYAVGRGRYETNYDQALVVMFNGTTGDVVWSKDIRFAEASDINRDARAVVVIPGSTDIMVAGTWYNPALSRPEIIMTRMTNAGTDVWQKTYAFDNNYWFNQELNLRATDNAIVLSLQQNTNNGSGWGCIQIDPDDGTVIRHRALSSDGNSNYTYYDTPTANFADVYSSGGNDYQVMAGYTYVPTDNYYNALLVKMPLDGYKNMAFEERVNLGEHILTRHDINSATVTAAFDAFTPDEHVNTFTVADDLKDYKIDDPSGYLKVWTYNITDDDAGYLEFGDGSKQSFATDKIPQIPAANDYYLTTQDSGKHIFFEHENGWVYILNQEFRNYPVGFTFTVVNTTGSDCFVETLSGLSAPRARLKLAGRNIDTYTIGIPDSGSGSMVTFLKIKDGYTIENSDGPGVYPDVWIVSGPSDVYDND